MIIIIIIIIIVITKVKLDMYKRFGKSVEFIYMDYVMQEVDFCLSLDRVHTV